MNAWLDRLIDLGLSADAACWATPPHLEWLQSEAKSRYRTGCGSFNPDGGGTGDGSYDYGSSPEDWVLDHVYITGYGTGDRRGGGAGNAVLWIDRT